MRVRQILGVCLCLAVEAGTSLGTETLPEWIWVKGGREGEKRVVVETTFINVGDVASARLRVTADFANAEVSLNGKSIAAIEAYDPPVNIDVRHLLEAGENRLVIRGSGVLGPSAIAAALATEFRNGSTAVTVTSGDWQGDQGRAVVSYGAIHPHRWAPNELPQVSPVAEYNQWKEAVPDAREAISPLPAGFAIERLRVAQEGEGSWVSLAIDSSGRLIVAREKAGLLRMTLPEKDDSEIAVEVIDDTLEECRGLVFVDGALFANANRAKEFWRLRDLDGDDRFEERTMLRATGGSVGHGRNDLALGPDGRIHSIHGDVVTVPEEARRRTVPELGAPKELGHWVSTTFDGEGWEIHTRGLRNPFGIDFNPDGEAFTYDADNEGDIGLPFYRPTRINHLVSGANYGWHQDRGNTRNLTVYAPDSVPTTFDVGRGSPTAVKFGTRSSFPPRYRDALFALDWAYGRILRVHLVPRGASYYASGDVFLEGRPLNVTDLEFDDAGAMYFVTGGRKTQSALFRVRYTGETVAADVATAQMKARSTFSAEARERRRRLERYHANPDPPDFEDAWEALGDPDPWIRNAARVGVETQDLERWRLRALGASGELHGLTALLALARAGNDEDGSKVVRRVTELESMDWNRTEKLTALRTYEICKITSQGTGDELLAAITRQVAPWLSSNSDPVRREAVRLLVAAGAPGAVAGGLRLQAEATDQLERLHYLEMLSEARSGWTPERREVFFGALVHASNFSNGDRFMPAFFAAVEANALANVEEAERGKFAPLLANEASSKASGLEEQPPRDFVKEWKLDDFSDILVGSLGNRDRERGRKMFDAALCGRCHMVGATGRPVGPDLTQVTSRFSRRDLLEAILEPSQVVAEVHRNIVLQRVDGTRVQGRIIQNDYRKSIIYLSTNPFLPGDFVEIPKGEIESFEASPISPMPPGLLNTLTREEVLDLIAWIEAGGADR